MRGVTVSKPNVLCPQCDSPRVWVAHCYASTFFRANPDDLYLEEDLRSYDDMEADVGCDYYRCEECEFTWIWR